MRFAIYSEREQRRRDDRQTMDGGQVRIPRRRAEYEYRCRSRTAFSPAGSVRVGYGLPSAGHSLPSALRCPKFLCSLPLREISTAARFTPCLLPPQAAAGRETPFKSKQKSTSQKCSPNRDSFSPAGSVRARSAQPLAGHSLRARSNPHLSVKKTEHNVLR